MEQNSLLGAPSRITLSHCVQAPLLYALRYSTMHVSEQNSFLPVCVGRTYCNGSLPSPHHVHVAFFAGRPRARCCVGVCGVVDVEFELAALFPLLPLLALALLSRPPDIFVLFSLLFTVLLFFAVTVTIKINLAS